MTRADLIEALIARVEAAEGPSRELDAEIARATGWTTYPVGWWLAPDKTSHTEPPRYSESLDAAAALVPEGHNWSLDVLLRDGNEARTFYGAHPNEIDTEATGATPALALTAAALRARMAMQMEGEG